MAAGYLDYEPVGGKYQFRPRVPTPVFSLLSNMRVLQLQRLATASGCTVSLASPDAPKMIDLDRRPGEVIPYYFSAGSAIDMARTATGPSLSCFAPDGGNKFGGGHDLMRLCRRIDMHGCMHRYNFRSIAEDASQAAEKRLERRVVADRSMPITYRQDRGFFPVYPAWWLRGPASGHCPSASSWPEIF